MEFYRIDLDSLLALVLIFGVIPSLVLAGIIHQLKNRRYKIERQAELMSKMIEKGDSSNLDFKAMAEALQEPKKAEALQEPKKNVSTKKWLLSNLRWGCICTLVGVALLGVALYAHLDLNTYTAATFLIFGGVIGGVGIALLLTFFISNAYLKNEIKSEEDKLKGEN